MARTVNETTITIRGASIQLRTDMDDEVLTELATYVDDKMREASRAAASSRWVRARRFRSPLCTIDARPRQ